MMNAMNARRWFLLGIGCLLLTLFLSLRPTAVVSQAPLNQLRFEYRVIEVPPDTRSIQAALDEYGRAGWELAAFEMGELQAPRLIFKKAEVPPS
jgi:hypothetical protein